ncbi:hypothetical protein EMGBS7_05320 [Candidatus Planktophila sp.]|nr:hypothetical protein EMGBS7_05320 [Candidatus Planktophila sp.]
MAWLKALAYLLVVGGANRAKQYGVEESKLGEFYAQRTILKKEVLPEHIAAAVFVILGGD